MQVTGAPPDGENSLRVTMPTAAQLSALPELARVRVPPEWQDLNGHVNVKHHLGMYDLTNDAMLALLGISADWVRRERIGLVDLEHHIWFQRELHVDEEVALYLRITARNTKRTQGVVFLFNAGDGEVASAIEFVSVAVHLDTRRAVALPAVVCERIDALLRDQIELDWPAPRSGAISL